MVMNAHFAYAKIKLMVCSWHQNVVHGTVCSIGCCCVHPQMREAEEKRKEMIRLRLLQQYQEAKLKRQNRIKSRKYRKLARKQKEKERQKEIEQLRKTDPEKALELMREDEKTRILERATLRHRNNSKFMQLQARRAKNDKEVRFVAFFII